MRGVCEGCERGGKGCRFEDDVPPRNREVCYGVCEEAMEPPVSTMGLMFIISDIQVLTG